MPPSVDTLYYAFSTIAQTLAGVIAILAAFAVMRLTDLSVRLRSELQPLGNHCQYPEVFYGCLADDDFAGAIESIHPGEAGPGTDEYFIVDACRRAEEQRKLVLAALVFSLPLAGFVITFSVVSLVFAERLTSRATLAWMALIVGLVGLVVSLAMAGFLVARLGPRRRKKRRKVPKRSNKGQQSDWPKRLHQLLFGLFYPAVLGAFLYDLLIAGESATVLARMTALDGKVLVATLLVVHFVLDFILTQEVAVYDSKIFMVDGLVVVLLFASYGGVHLHDAGRPADVRRIALSLFLTYLCFLLWQYLRRSHLGTSRALVIYEVLAGVTFLGIGVFQAPLIFLGVALAAASVTMAVVGSRILTGYHQPVRSQPG